MSSFMRRRLSTIAAAACLVVVTACGGPSKAELGASLAEAGAYMAKSAKEPGVVTLPSGLQYQIVRSGPATGLRPGKADEVKVHYEGKLTTGKVFDSSYENGVPANFVVGALIPAWTEALQLMRPGDEWRLIVPPSIGYGEAGAGGGAIPSNAVLLFRLELIDVLPSPQVGRG